MVFCNKGVSCRRQMRRGVLYVESRRSTITRPYVMGIAMLMAPQIWKNNRGERMSQCDEGEALTFKTGGKAGVRQEVFLSKQKPGGFILQVRGWC